MSNIQDPDLSAASRAFQPQEQDIIDSTTKTVDVLAQGSAAMETPKPLRLEDRKAIEAQNSFSGIFATEAALGWSEAQKAGGRYKRSGEAYTAKDFAKKYAPNIAQYAALSVTDDDGKETGVINVRRDLLPERLGLMGGSLTRSQADNLVKANRAAGTDGGAALFAFDSDMPISEVMRFVEANRENNSHARHAAQLAYERAIISSEMGLVEKAKVLVGEQFIGGIAAGTAKLLTEYPAQLYETLMYKTMEMDAWFNETIGVSPNNIDGTILENHIAKNYGGTVDRFLDDIGFRKHAAVTDLAGYESFGVIGEALPQFAAQVVAGGGLGILRAGSAFSKIFANSRFIASGSVLGAMQSQAQQFAHYKRMGLSDSQATTNAMIDGLAVGLLVAVSTSMVNGTSNILMKSPVGRKAMATAARNHFLRTAGYAAGGAIQEGSQEVVEGIMFDGINAILQELKIRPAEDVFGDSVSGYLKSKWMDFFAGAVLGGAAGGLLGPKSLRSRVNAFEVAYRAGQTDINADTDNQLKVGQKATYADGRPMLDERGNQITIFDYNLETVRQKFREDLSQQFYETETHDLERGNRLRRHNRQSKAFRSMFGKLGLDIFGDPDQERYVDADGNDYRKVELAETFPGMAFALAGEPNPVENNRDPSKKPYKQPKGDKHSDWVEAGLGEFSEGLTDADRAALSQTAKESVSRTIGRTKANSLRLYEASDASRGEAEARTTEQLESDTVSAPQALRTADDMSRDLYNQYRNQGYSDAEAQELADADRAQILSGDIDDGLRDRVIAARAGRTAGDADTPGAVLGAEEFVDRFFGAMGKLNDRQRRVLRRAGRLSRLGEEALLEFDRSLPVLSKSERQQVQDDYGKATSMDSIPEKSRLKEVLDRFSRLGEVIWPEQGDSRLPPEADQLVQAARALGITVIFVDGNNPNFQGVRDARTGAIAINVTSTTTQNSENVLRTYIETVLSHELVHTLQHEGEESRLRELRDSIVAVNPNILKNAARRAAAVESAVAAERTSRETGGQVMTSPVVTDGEAAAYLANNPDKLPEVLAYAVEEIASSSSAIQTGQFLRRLAGKSPTMMDRVRSLITGLTSSVGVESAGKYQVMLQLADSVRATPALRTDGGPVTAFAADPEITTVTESKLLEPPQETSARLAAESSPFVEEEEGEIEEVVEAIVDRIESEKTDPFTPASEPEPVTPTIEQFVELTVSASRARAADVRPKEQTPAAKKAGGRRRNILRGAEARRRISQDSNKTLPVQGAEVNVDVPDPAKQSKPQTETERRVSGLMLTVRETMNDETADDADLLSALEMVQMLESQVTDEKQQTELSKMADELTQRVAGLSEGSDAIERQASEDPDLTPEEQEFYNGFERFGDYDPRREMDPEEFDFSLASPTNPVGIENRMLSAFGRNNIAAHRGMISGNWITGADARGGVIDGLRGKVNTRDIPQDAEFFMLPGTNYGYAVTFEQGNDVLNANIIRYNAVSTVPDSAFDGRFPFEMIALHALQIAGDRATSPAISVNFADMKMTGKAKQNLKMRRAAIEMMGGDGGKQRIRVDKRTAERAYEIAFGKWATDREGDRVIGFSGTDNLHIFLRNADEASLEGPGGRVPEHIEQAVIRGDEDQLESIVVNGPKGGVAQGLATMFAKARFAKQFVSGPTRIADRSARELNRTFSVMAQMDGGYRKIDSVPRQMDSLEVLLRAMDPEGMDANPDLVMMFIAAAARTEVDAKAIALGLAAYRHHRINKSLLGATQDAVDVPFPFNIGRGMSVGQYERLMFVSANAGELSLADLTEVGELGKFDAVRRDEVRPRQAVVVSRGGEFTTMNVRDRLRGMGSNKQIRRADLHFTLAGSEFLAVAADRTYQPITPGHVAMWNASKGFRIGYEGNIQDSLDRARRLLMNRKAAIDTGPFLLMDLLYSDSNLLQYLDMVATQKVDRSNMPRGLSRIADNLATRAGDDARPSTPRSRTEGVAIRQDIENLRGRNINTEAIAIAHGSGFNVAGAAVELMESLSDPNSTVDFIAADFEYSLNQLPKSITAVDFEVDTAPDGRVESYIYTTEKGQEIKTVIQSSEPVPDFFEHNLSFYMDHSASLVGWDHDDSYERRMALTIPKLMARMVEDRIARGENGGVRLDGLSLTIAHEDDNAQRLNYKRFLLRAARHMAYKTGVPHAVLVGVTIDDRGDVAGDMVVMPTNRYDALAAFDQNNAFGGVFQDQQSRSVVRQDKYEGFAHFANLQMEMTIVNPEEQTLAPQKSPVFEHLSRTGARMTSTDVDNFLHALKVQAQKDAEFEAEQQESPFAALGMEEPDFDDEFEYSLTPESAARVFDMFETIKFNPGDGTLRLTHKGLPKKQGRQQMPDFELVVTVGNSISFKAEGLGGYEAVDWKQIAQDTGYPEYNRLGLAIFGRIVPAWAQTVLSGKKVKETKLYATFSGPKGRANYIPMFIRMAERLSKKHGVAYLVSGSVLRPQLDADGDLVGVSGMVGLQPMDRDNPTTMSEAIAAIGGSVLPVQSENFNFKEYMSDIAAQAKRGNKLRRLPPIVVGIDPKLRATFKEITVHPFYAATRRELGKVARPQAAQLLSVMTNPTETDKEFALYEAGSRVQPFPTSQIRATLAEMSKAGEVDLDFEYSLSMDSVRSARDFAGRFVKSHFHKEGNLPEEIFDMKLRKDAEIRADLERARYNNAELKKAINAIPAEQRPKLAVVNEALTTNDFSALESFPEVVKAGQAMRAHIKKMSKRLIDEGVVEGQLAARIDKNGDTYLHRSYRVFDDPNWASKVPEEVRNNAKAKLREQFPESSEDQIEQMIGELLYSGKAAESPMAILASTTKIGGKDLSILMGRKDIPDWLMALWGEYDDPFINYTKSIGKIATLAANHKFLTTVREFGLASGLFSDLQSDEVDPAHVAEFATKSSMAFAPLNGLRTTPELKQAFEEAAANTHIDQWWLRNYMKFNSGVKWSKTIGSPLTHLRNLVGNLGFAVANGHIPNGSIKMKDLIGVTGLFGQREEAAQEKYEEYVRLGVVQSGSFREVFDAVQEAGGLSVEEWANRWAERGGARAAASKAAKAAQGTVEFMNKAYMAEDDIWKIFAYETELKRYSGAYAKSGQPVPETLKQDVAKIIQNTYPNYDNVPKFIKSLRQVPFMGTFTSFPWEVGRTAVNRILLTHKELRSDNPEIRKIGMQRAVGQLSAIMGAYVLQEVAAAILGFDDEELEAVRQLAAPWNENSPMVLLPGEDGKVRFIDLGYVDPHSYFTKPILAMFRADDIGLKKALVSAVNEITDPFFGEEILFGRILDVARNKKRSGSKVYLDAAPLTQRVLEGSKYILGAIEPGLVDQFIRTPYRAVMGYTNDYGKTYSLPYHLFQQTTGLKIETIDPRQAFSFRAATFARNESSLTGYLRKVAGRRGTVSDRELESTYAMVNRNRQQNMDAFQRQINALVALGVKPREVAAILKQANVSKKSIPALINGKHVPVQVDANYLDRQFARSVVQTPDAPLSRISEVRRRLEVLRRAQQATE